MPLYLHNRKSILMRYLLLLLLIACRPDPIEPPNELTYVRWYSVSNPNYYFSLKDYDPCNPLYGSCKDLYWLDVNDNKFVAKIRKDTIYRYSNPLIPDTLLIVKHTYDTLVLRMSGLNNKYKR